MFFIIIPTNAHVSSIKLVLKLLRHVSVFLRNPHGAHKLCQLKLCITKMENTIHQYVVMVKLLVKCGRICNLSL